MSNVAAADFEFTAADKYREIRREISLRRGAYPRFIQSGGLSVNDARRRIAIMEAIADDYKRLAERDRGPLFA
jgi:hypothetical protein